MESAMWANKKLSLCHHDGHYFIFTYRLHYTTIQFHSIRIKYEFYDIQFCFLILIFYDDIFFVNTVGISLTRLNILNN